MQPIKEPIKAQRSDEGKRTPITQSIDWYHEGESRAVEVDGIRVTVRFVGRKGRRGRIAIVAPAGASFQAGELPS